MQRFTLLVIITSLLFVGCDEAAQQPAQQPVQTVQDISKAPTDDFTATYEQYVTALGAPGTVTSRGPNGAVVYLWKDKAGNTLECAFSGEDVCVALKRNGR